MFEFKTKKPEESSSNWKPWYKDWDAITSNHSEEDAINDEGKYRYNRKGFLEDDESSDDSILIVDPGFMAAVRPGKTALKYQEKRMAEWYRVRRSTLFKTIEKYSKTDISLKDIHDKGFTHSTGEKKCRNMLCSSCPTRHSNGKIADTLLQPWRSRLSAGKTHVAIQTSCESCLNEARILEEEPLNKVKRYNKPKRSRQRSREKWSTLGEPSGKWDYYVKYDAPPDTTLIEEIAATGWGDEFSDDEVTPGKEPILEEG
ncbi:hypothetical protein Tco_0390266 [Tanacetum coccineum]